MGFWANNPNGLIGDSQRRQLGSLNGQDRDTLENVRINGANMGRNGQQLVRGVDQGLRSALDQQRMSTNGQAAVRTLDNQIYEANGQLPPTVGPSVTQSQASWFDRNGTAQNTYDKQRMQEYAASQQAQSGLRAALNSGTDERTAVLNYQTALSKPVNVDKQWNNELQSRSLQKRGFSFAPIGAQTQTAVPTLSTNNMYDDGEAQRLSRRWSSYSV